MGLEALDQFIRKPETTMVVPVDLLKIARTAAQQQPLSAAAQRHPAEPRPPVLNLVLDADSCLDRLYGGFFSDWISGGQWNRMSQFLQNLVAAFNKHGLHVTIMFNGAQDSRKLQEWIKAQHASKLNINQVFRHLAVKGTPPPKIWWTAPPCLQSSLRTAIGLLNVNIITTVEDHAKEVIGYCVENHCHGLIADGPEYVIFRPSRLFSASQLKLTYKNSLETTELLFDEVAKSLELGTDRLPLLATLLSNFLLPDTDLHSFHRSLPKQDKNPETLLTSIAKFIRDLPSVDKIDDVVAKVFGANANPDRLQRFKASIDYYSHAKLRVKTKSGGLKKAKPNAAGGKMAASIGQLTLSESDLNCDTLLNGANALQPENGFHTANGNSGSPSQFAAAGAADDGGCEDKVPHEILQKAKERHRHGQMVPWIYHVLAHRELRINVALEEEQLGSATVVPSAKLFQPIRQSVYAILFNIHHKQYVAKQKGAQGQVTDVPVREWIYPYTEAQVVYPQPLEWAVPTVQRLWLGSTNPEDPLKRLKAFLSCMRADNINAMTNPTYVPQPYLILCCVLRYLVTESVLRRHELDAFLCTAVSPQLSDSQTIQATQMPQVSTRGVHIASLFMRGVEHAMFVNDACGAPILPQCSAPWYYFDGKLFQLKLAKTQTTKNLVDLCDQQIDQVAMVERMRQAILEGLHVEFARPPLNTILPPLAPVPPLLGGGGQFGNPTQGKFGRGNGNVGGGGGGGPQRGFNQQGGRPSLLGGPNQQNSMLSRGGHLEVAGVVVSQWGSNYGSSSQQHHLIGANRAGANHKTRTNQQPNKNIKNNQNKQRKRQSSQNEGQQHQPLAPSLSLQTTSPQQLGDFPPVTDFPGAGEGLGRGCGLASSPERVPTAIMRKMVSEQQMGLSGFALTGNTEN